MSLSSVDGASKSYSQLKQSLSLSPVLSRRAMTTSLSSSSGSTPFSNRRGNMKFSSGRFTPLRSSTRSRKGNILSFRSTRRTAARPTRTKGIFENLLTALTDGVEAVRGCVDEMKKQRLAQTATCSRMNFYMDLEKQIKGLERKIRTLEVHKDRIEEMKDEYVLKLKLRDGAFNLAQALSTQSSRAAKEKLAEVRIEQRDLLEDLCDIEEELETKLGVFKVHINGLVGLSRVGTADTYEAQLKLASQKWKARCKVSRHNQMWQDEDIIFLGKVTDELFVKVTEVRRIQGNNQIGSMKCQTRELFSFLPLSVSFNFPSSNVKLSMDVRWSPVIGEDFLSDLDLPTIHCLVGGQQPKSLASLPSSCGNVERLQLYPHEPLITGLNPSTNVHQIRIITEPDDSESRSSNSYGRSEVKTENIRKKSPRPKKKRGKDESDFVFLDRHSVMNLDEEEVESFPEARELLDNHHRTHQDSTASTDEIEISNAKYPPGARKSSLDSTHSSDSGSAHSDPLRPPKSPDAPSLMLMLEAVMCALEEPREQYPELRALDMQLARLEAGLKSGKLQRAPSMTLSECQAMDSFEFLCSEDTELLPRYSRASFSDFPEEVPLIRRSSSSAGDRCPRSSAPLFSVGSHASREEGTEFHQASVDSQTDEVFPPTNSSGYHEGTGSSSASGISSSEGSTGVASVDRALLQHLIHCECLLQHLQSAGPLNQRLVSGLRKLRTEAEILAELMNIAANPEEVSKIDHIIPELGANEQLLKFWRSVAKDDLLSVSYEQFAVGLDEKFGQALWTDFPQVANKVFSELLNRVLDLEDYNPADTKMMVTVFQFAAYFLRQAGGVIQKCMREVAQELKITEGLDSNEAEDRQEIASQLVDCSYNRGALLASAHLLADHDPTPHGAAVKYLERFAGSSPWHSKAVQYCIELLEHTDQAVRIGACAAIGILGAKAAVIQLRYLAKRDFSPVRTAAYKALSQLGESSSHTSDSDSADSSQQGFIKQSSTKSLLTPEITKKPLQRTRSAEAALSSIAADSLGTTRL